MIVIYGIVDPITNQLRYVGQTTNFKKRKNAHYRIAIKNSNRTHVYNWLRSLYNKSKDISSGFKKLQGIENCKGRGGIPLPCKPFIL